MTQDLRLGFQGNYFMSGGTLTAAMLNNEGGLFQVSGGTPDAPVVITADVSNIGEFSATGAVVSFSGSFFNEHAYFSSASVNVSGTWTDVFPVDLGGTDDMANLLPACRSCNNYKSTLTLEKFRQAVRHWPTVLMRDSVTFRNAVRFGMVKPTPHSVTFYFETLGIHVEEYGAACAGEGGSQ